MDKLFLKEKRDHGSVDFPFHIISHTDKLGTYSVPHHWHDEIEIIYLEYGHINIYCNEQEYILSPGDFYVVNTNELHHILGVTPSLHHAIIFHPKLLDFNFFDKTEETYIKPITSGHSKFVSQIYQDTKYTDVLSTLTKTDYQNYLTIKILLYTLINHFYQENNIQVDFQPDKYNDLKKVILFIQNNYNTSLTLEMIANQLMISPNHLCKYFKKKMGMTVFQYINQYRINRAIYHLLHTDLSVIDIALDCGFDNISYFIRTFKNVTGTTPKQYRKMKS